jgi:hypothetical protein
MRNERVDVRLMQQGCEPTLAPAFVRPRSPARFVRRRRPVLLKSKFAGPAPQSASSQTRIVWRARVRRPATTFRLADFPQLLVERQGQRIH